MAKQEIVRNASFGGSVIAAIAASACCVGPLVFALLGIGGAGFLVTLEPYRPLFTVVTLGLLGSGYYLTYRTQVAVAAAPTATDDDCGCEMPKTNRAGKRTLWLATALVVLALAFPYATPYLF